MVHTIGAGACGARSLADGTEAGEHVDLAEHRITGFASRNTGRPPYDQWHARAAFKHA